MSTVSILHVLFSVVWIAGTSGTIYNTCEDYIKSGNQMSETDTITIHPDGKTPLVVQCHSGRVIVELGHAEDFTCNGPIALKCRGENSAVDMLDLLRMIQIMGTETKFKICIRMLKDEVKALSSIGSVIDLTHEKCRNYNFGFYSMSSFDSNVMESLPVSLEVSCSDVGQIYHMHFDVTTSK